MSDPKNNPEDTEPDFENGPGTKPDIVAAVNAVPATYVDTFHIATWPGHVRITFGETTPLSDAAYRVAVVLPTEDAMGLSEMIAKMVEKERTRTAEEK